MKQLNTFQENCVLVALCQNWKYSLGHKFYDITSDVMIQIIEFIDEYTNYDIGRIKVIFEKTDDILKENLYIELYDVICDYLKHTK